MNDTEDASNVTAALYCGEATVEFHDAYAQIHGYVSLLVCVFGSITNTLNIAVLTRREMVSPTNAILTGLAVADLLVMLEYIPYVVYADWGSATLSYRDRFSYTRACFIYFHSVFGQIGHTVSIWLTVTLAVWRYIAVAHQQVTRRWCNMRSTAITIAGAYLVCPLICLPFALSVFIGGSEELILPNGDKATDLGNGTANAQNVTLYILKFNDGAMRNAIFWVYSVVIKLIPCIALTILSSKLIMVLVETKKRRRKLMTPGVVSAAGEDGKVAEDKPGGGLALQARRRAERQTDRTTRMLLAVLFLFLVTEFPQGIMGLLIVLLGDDFFTQCYTNYGDLMDALALVNSGINFVLYCTMSRQFRTTFAELFRPRALDRWLPVPLREGAAAETDACALNGDKTQMTQV